MADNKVISDDEDMARSDNVVTELCSNACTSRRSRWRTIITAVAARSGLRW